MDTNKATTPNFPEGIRPDNQDSVSFDVDSSLLREHLSRYFWAAELGINKKVLDCACGKGYGAYVMAKKAQTVIGVDLNQESIATAQAKFIKPNLRYIVEDALKAKEIEGTFDLITAFEIIEHIPTEESDSFISGLKRSLNETGTLLLSTPNHDVVTKSGVFVPEYHINNFRPQELKRCLNKHFSEVTMLGLFEKRAPLNHFIFSMDYLNIRHTASSMIKRHGKRAVDGETPNKTKLPPDFFDSRPNYLDRYIFSKKHWRQAGLTVCICKP